METDRTKEIIYLGAFLKGHQFNNEVQHLGEQKGYPKCLWQKNTST